MKTLSCIFLLVCTTIFSANREENLKAIVEISYLNEQFTPALNFLAGQAVEESQKQIDPQTLVETFQKEFSKKENLAKLFEPYATVFSDEEIKELRNIIENPVWQKMMLQGNGIVQSHVETFRSLFQDIAKRL